MTNNLGRGVDVSESTSAKTCRKCGAAKALSEFTPTPTGVRSRCRSCLAADRRASRQADPDRYRLQERALRQSNPDGFRAKEKRYRDNNPEVVRASRSGWRQRNPEVARETVRDWQRRNPEATKRALQAFKDNNPDYFIQASKRRRALRKGATVGPIDLASLWAESNGLCGLCGLTMDAERTYPDPMSRSIDHIIPLSLGGSHEQSNVQWTHLRCNVKKGNRPTP